MYKIFNFETEQEARRCLCEIEDWVYKHETISFSRIKLITGRSNMCDEDRGIWWSKNSIIINSCVRQNALFSCWELCLPQPDNLWELCLPQSDNLCEKPIVDEREKKEFTLCNITIDTSSMKEPERIIREVFKLAGESKDANVFIYIC